MEMQPKAQTVLMGLFSVLYCFAACYAERHQREQKTQQRIIKAAQWAEWSDLLAMSHIFKVQWRTRSNSLIPDWFNHPAHKLFRLLPSDWIKQYEWKTASHRSWENINLTDPPLPPPPTHTYTCIKQAYLKVIIEYSTSKVEVSYHITWVNVLK